MAGAMFLLSSGASAAEQCQLGEKPLEFRFFTDNNSWKDNGWILECDSEDGHRELVWSIPIGALDLSSHTEVIREAACVPDTSTCTLNIFDAAGDGLQGGNNGKPGANTFAGWFALLHGSNTVATYKGLEKPEFSELSYCVGPNCDLVPQQVHDEDCQDTVYLAMQLDNNPTDTSYQLICGGEGDGVFDKTVYWSGSGFTEPGAYVEEETCLPKDACCEFIVVDGNSNGLTETVKTTRNGSGAQSQGFIYLEMNFEPVLEYDGSNGEKFGVLTKKFACAAENENIFEAPQEKEDEDKDVITTVVIDIEDDNGEEEELTIEIDQDNENEKVTVEVDIDDVDVGDNVDGVFDPEKEDEDKKEFSDSFKNAFEDNIQDNEEDFINVDWMMDGTVAPTSEGWVADDDYQNFNDDGQGFGTFDDDYLFDSYFGDDVVSTSAPTSENYIDWEPWFSDDVTNEDDAAWTMMDDQMLAPDGMAEIDGMIQDLDDHTLKLPTDPMAAALMNGDLGKVEKSGLSKNAKIAIGVVVPVVVLWAVGMAACYYYGPEEEDDEDSEGKGTTGDSSINGESVVENV